MRIVAGLVAAALASTSALAADVIYAPRPVIGFVAVHALPDCGDPGVLKDVARKFAFQDGVLTKAGLAIVEIEQTRQTRFKDGPSLTDVRYCTGVAWLNNGRRSEVVYIIEGPMKGPFSLGWAVESCLPGYDPFRVYDGNCRSIRG